MAPIFAIIRYALLETFFCIPILPKTHRAENSTEEIVLEIYDNDLIDSTKVKKAIESSINKQFNKKQSGGTK